MNRPALPWVGVLVALTTACSGVASPPTSTATTTPATTTTTAAGTTTLTPIEPESLHGTIVYSSDIIDGNADVFVLHLGGDPVRLTDGPEQEFDPDLSPDGTTIAYRRNPDPNADDADIWVMSVDGSDKRNLTNAPELSNWAPSWTPEGRIAFSRLGSTGELEPWTMAADGSDAHRIAAGWCEYPQPSPDGSEFVCARPIGGRYDIFIVTATGERRALTSTPETEFGPAWSPDGEWIAFSRDEGGRWTLLLIRPDGTGEHEVTSEGVFPTWDPDGHLVWSGIGGINVAHPDGSGAIVLDYPAEFISWGE